MTARSDHRWRQRLNGAAVLSAGLVLAGAAAAQSSAEKAAAIPKVTVTESTSLIYNGNNRNTRIADVASAADDGWGMSYNRLNLHSNWRSFRASARIDSALYFTSRSPTDISLGLLRDRHGGSLPTAYSNEDASFFVQKFDQAGRELSTRFVNWVYPAKLHLSYASPELDAALGDFYAQFGRGLVLSVRKEDELTSDTSIRGAQVKAKLKTKHVRMALTALGGTLNPLRVDETSGRNLAVTRAVTPGIARFTELGMPRAISNDFVSSPRPNFAPDLLMGGQLSAKLRGVGFALQGARLRRPCLELPAGCEPLGKDTARSARTIDTGSVSLNLPALGSIGALYIEYARQRLSDFGATRRAQSGSALYGSLNLEQGPLIVTLEGKHYRSFFPLRASVDLGSAREFSTVQYSKPPTTEPIWNDTEFEGFNTCVSGGRAKFDLRMSRDVSVFTSLSRYNTWAESSAAGSCIADRDNLNRVWDIGQGLEISAEHRKTRARSLVGTRFDQTARALETSEGGSTHVFYRELYLRYDIIKSLGADLALQLQGWHRRRRQTLGGPALPWLQGQTINSLQIGEKWSVALGLEYDQNPAFPSTYVNGQLRYNLSTSDNVSLFIGQRQGGLRCISGICRIFPPFEGGRVDATFRF